MPKSCNEITNLRCCETDLKHVAVNYVQFRQSVTEFNSIFDIFFKKKFAKYRIPISRIQAAAIPNEKLA